MNSVDAPAESAAITRDLRRLLGDHAIVDGTDRRYCSDATEGRGMRGHSHCIALVESTEQASQLIGWCYRNDVAIVPRGGGSGFAGGAVADGNAVTVCTERMTSVLDFEPLLWRMHVQAGVTTARVRSVAQQSGLLFPPDPGAAEQSHIGGNIATNAGGPHALKYGVTGAWVTGLEVVIAEGEVLTLGGPLRKDVAGYDLVGLLVGSEGTLGLVTAAWLKLLPAPQAQLPIAACFETVEQGCAAIEMLLASGVVPSAVEFLDAGSLAAAGVSFPSPLPAQTGMLLLVEADGTHSEAVAARDELVVALSDDALAIYTPETGADVAALWRWRDGVSIAVEATLGGKVSEDIVVPIDRLAEAINATVQIGRRHGLEALSWGHAGDGNLHSTFLVTPSDREQLESARRAAAELFEMALGLGGSISGEHGIGRVKLPYVEAQHGPALMELQHGIKSAFDPKGLFNPGVKLPVR